MMGLILGRCVSLIFLSWMPTSASDNISLRNKHILSYLVMLLLPCCSVAQSCLILCDPTYCSMPGLPVPHHHPRFAQVHVYCIGDAIQPSHSLSTLFSFCPQSFPASGTFPTFPQYSHMHYFLEVKHYFTLCQREVTHGHMHLHPSEVPRLGIWR